MIFNKRQPNVPGHRPSATAVRTQPKIDASPKVDSKHTLKVIPLGGIEEVDENMPGIDYIIPNTKYLEENKKRIKGVIITHGHLDHIGAIPYIMPKIGDP